MKEAAAVGAGLLQLGVTVGTEKVVELDGTFAGCAGVSLFDILEQGFLLQRPLIGLG